MNIMRAMRAAVVTITSTLRPKPAARPRARRDSWGFDRDYHERAINTEAGARWLGARPKGWLRSRHPQGRDR
jgi:hypothetical protein